jgi:hypothetical protein
MNREKKIGIIYLIIGILIPLLILPFTSGWSKEKSFYENFYGAGILIRNDNTDTLNLNTKKTEQEKESGIKFSRLIPKRVPFRFFLVITLIFWYLGIVRIDSSRKEKNDSEKIE